MKRLIAHIRNLFGADEKLRKWCLESVIKGMGPNLRACDRAMQVAIGISSGSRPENRRVDSGFHSAYMLFTITTTHNET